ncbi:MAG TPA: hypothetical protein VGD66_16210 [Allosphingosinicella sp.]|jgi:hypothetical protein
MSLSSTLKRLAKALPAILANVPTVLAAVREVADAVKKEKKPSGGEAAAPAAPLSPDPRMG